ncbi:hypothetical protein IW492_14125 [Enterococcus sp. BWB1-3]|uniref:hypothetical protein n=1 Tax=Enterococcus sp. BWB1-3 TaxID=2787713 RepID=UPI001920506E|nr:hypothetical protein [Enterococcus sp. BWB1-3]MBL1230370.1 hypothetical protein [Enterococcus sp. BWB1-3]
MKAEARIRKMCEGASTLWKGASKTASNIGKSAGGVITDFGKGAVAGVINSLANSNPGKAIAEAVTGEKIHANLSGGNNSLAYNLGELTSSLVIGVGGVTLAATGGTVFTGSGAGTVFSGGSATPVTVPGMAAGATLVVAGGAIAVGASSNAIEAGQNVIQNIVGGDGGSDFEDWGGKNKQSDAEYHYNQHGDEVGAKDFNDYTRKANAFKDIVQNKGKSPTKEVFGKTPNVFRYNYNGKYIDLEHIMGIDVFGLPKIIDYKIISYGTIK